MMKFIGQSIAALNVALFLLGLGALLDNAQSLAEEGLITLLSLMFASIVCVLMMLAACIKNSMDDEVRP